jgi:hypothetical protein
MKQNEHFSTLKSTICKKYSFQKLTEFSQGKDVLNTAASNIHLLFCRGTYVSATQLNRPIWRKYTPSPPRNPYVAGSIP